MALDTSKVLLPKEVATVITKRAKDTSTIASLSPSTPQIFSDVRTYWSADAIERVTGHRPEGRAAGGVLDGAGARAKLDAGASLVQLYSGLIYRGPGLVRECVRATDTNMA